MSEFFKNNIVQMLRYAFVGVALNLFGYFVYLFFTYFGFSPKVVMSALYCFGAFGGFWANKKITFGYIGNLKKTISLYSCAHIAGYVINYLLLYFFVDMLGFDHRVVQAGAICVVAIFLFFIFKYFVFAQSVGREVQL